MDKILNVMRKGIAVLMRNVYLMISIVAVPLFFWKPLGVILFYPAIMVMVYVGEALLPLYRYHAEYIQSEEKEVVHGTSDNDQQCADDIIDGLLGKD